MNISAITLFKTNPNFNIKSRQLKNLYTADNVAFGNSLISVKAVREDLGEDLFKRVDKKVIKRLDAEKIFNYFGIVVEKDEKGQLAISHYEQPSFYVTFADLGINEEKLLKNVVEIKGNADFNQSSIKKIKGLKYIYGDANFSNSAIESLGSLRSISGNADFSHAYDLVNLGKLKFIGRNADFGMNKLNTKKVKIFGSVNQF